jgi:hypothetical protein
VGRRKTEKRRGRVSKRRGRKGMVTVDVTMITDAVGIQETRGVGEVVFKATGGGVGTVKNGVAKTTTR